MMNDKRSVIWGAAGLLMVLAFLCPWPLVDEYEDILAGVICGIAAAVSLYWGDNSKGES